MTVQRTSARLLAAASTATVVCAAWAGCSAPFADEETESFPAGAVTSAKPPKDARATIVERVVDGDTVELRGLGSSRLIGVDTPETYESHECFGSRASRFTERTLEPGLRVRVLLGQEPEDDYGRDLVYLWLPNGRLFNAMLTRRGLARPLTIPPNDDLSALFERGARAAAVKGRGLWGACGP